jgi:Rieske Fe-S protein
MPLKDRFRSITRRDVLSASANLSWAVPLSMSLFALFKFLRFEPPTSIATQIALSAGSSIPPLPAYIEAGQVWLHQDDQGYYAVDAICTHLGCTVRSNPEDGGYVCRCHGSRFDASGGVIHGPAVLPLHFLKLTWNSSQQIVVDRAAQVDPSFRLPLL